MKPRHSLSILSTVLLSSCVLHPSPDQATVCPACETVLIEDIDVTDGTPVVTHHREHDCPGCQGCQGALVTFFKEGKLQHRCSICGDGGFRCPINHPITKS